MRESCYWIASHITGIFEIVDSDDLTSRGSRGAGINLARGGKTRVRTGNEVIKTEISINNQSVPVTNALVTAEVIRLFFELTGKKEVPMKVNHAFDIPMSAGFGASAAGALGTAFCLNDLFSGNLSKEKLFELAHVSEAQHWCGLGDILALYQEGGTEIRTAPGTPGKGRTESFILNRGARVFTCSLGPLKTSSILNHPDYRRKIITKGRVEIEKLINNPTQDAFMDGCRAFSDFVGLSSKRAREITSEFANRGLEQPATIMIGNGLFIITSDDKTLKHLLGGEQPFNLFREEKLAGKTFRKAD